MLLTNNIIRRIICTVIEYKTQKNITEQKILLQNKRKQTTDKKRNKTQNKRKTTNNKLERS